MKIYKLGVTEGYTFGSKVGFWVCSFVTVGKEGPQISLIGADLILRSKRVNHESVRKDKNTKSEFQRIFHEILTEKSRMKGGHSKGAKGAVEKLEGSLCEKRKQ